MIRPKERDEPLLYVEAESLNSDLKGKKEGIAQVRSWLISRASKTDYGLATDGLQWFLLKFDSASAQTKIMLKVDLRPVFIKLQNSAALVTRDEISSIEKDFLYLDEEYISSFLREKLETIEIHKDDISQKFYNDYVKNVFGYDKSGNQILGTCLLNKIDPPLDTPAHDKNLFAVVLMNRLIFTKFLEEKGIVPKDFLKKLLTKYKSLALPSTFYQTYLKPLFYEVFNKGEINRREEISTHQIFKNIPYLNGGLFNEVVSNESSYNVGNDGIELVINNLLNEYDFGSDSVINPDILGYIFEKTINFISGTGTNQQKMKGAYYTPDDVVEFIIEETLTPIIFKKMCQGLKDSGWDEKNIQGYHSLNDILDPANRPKNPLIIRNMLKRIDEIKILDPACGSGHFLTAVLSFLLRVKEDLLLTIEDNVQRYQIKRDIISKNIFGVDIDENAIEIARLRLWLSLIEEVEDTEHIETLPNIDFNILVGNSLIGWLDERLSKHPLVSLLEDSYIEGTLDSFELIYGEKISKIRELLKKLKLKDTIQAYKQLLELYSSESGERAVKIRTIIEKIRNKLYTVINDSYLAFLYDKFNLRKVTLDELKRCLNGINPFHWKIDFENVFAKGGFDVVVGNPPYGNLLKNDEKKVMFYYSTKNASEIAANFLERIFPLTRKNGLIGLVLANSIAINKSTAMARKLIKKNMTKSEMALFGTRPSKLFKDVEIRVMIFVGEKDEPENFGVIFTTEAIKFKAEQRKTILNDLSFESTENLTLGKTKIGDKLADTSLPKVGNPLIRSILLKLKENSEIVFGQRISSQGFEHSLQFRKTGGYWLNALEEMPYHSTKIETIMFEHEVERDFSIILINSSLFYLYWSTYGNLRDLPPSLLKKFPFPSLDKIKQYSDKILTLKKSVSDCLLNSFLPNVGQVGEFRTAQCRLQIDSIDELLGDIYGLTSVEIDFVKKYDKHIRK